MDDDSAQPPTADVELDDRQLGRGRGSTAFTPPSEPPNQAASPEGAPPALPKLPMLTPVANVDAPAPLVVDVSTPLPKLFLLMTDFLIARRLFSRRCRLDIRVGHPLKLHALTLILLRQLSV